MSVTTQLSTEERILAAATALFYEKGYHGASMREVAAEVGIKPASLYNHFPSKEDLLFRIAYGTMAELLEGGLAAIAPHASARERLRALLVWHVTYHAERRFQARVADEQLHALGGSRREEALGIRDEYTSLFKSILEEGREAHGWNVPNTSVITFGIGGMCTFVDTWFREDGPLSAAAIAEIYADFVLAALETGPRG
jgi:AcrR family transcriptional regulator